MDESFRVLGPSPAQGAFAFLKNALSPTVMDVVGGDHRDPGMTMLGVVPGDGGPAESDRGGDIGEAPGEAGVVLQGLELGFGDGGLSSLT